MYLLVTGGCGFIGSNYIRYVLNNYEQINVVNVDALTYAGNLQNLQDVQATYGPDRYFFECSDITNCLAIENVFNKYQIDAVINFAAESHVDRSIHDPSLFIKTNVLGTQVLLTAALTAGVKRFVHVSTDEVYGDLALTDPAFVESTPLNPSSPYSASKAAADMLVHAFQRTYDFDVVITRCSNNYGPYQFPEKLIPLMTSLALEEKTLPIYGDGSNIRDWIHVLDHCRGVHLALLKGRSGSVYNFGGSAERTNLDVVRTILGELGKDRSLITFVHDRPGHDWRYAMNYEHAQNELGYSPEFTFESGIKETITWYRNNTAWVDSIRSGEYLKFIQKQYGFVANA